MTDSFMQELNNKISDLHVMVARIDERTANTAKVVEGHIQEISALKKAQWIVAGAAAGIAGFISNLPIIKDLLHNGS